MAQLRDLLVNGASRFLSAVNFNDDVIFNKSVTLNETLILANTTDAKLESYTSPALVIGDKTGVHLEIDGNEILAKTTESTSHPLYLNSDGGQVSVGAGGIATSGSISANGSLTASNIIITSTETGVNHIQFAREYNYLKGPANSHFVFLTNGSNAGSSAQGSMIISTNAIWPGASANGADGVALGKSSNRWASVYASGLDVAGIATITGNVTIGANSSNSHVINGTTMITGNLIPGTTKTYSLGTSARYWKNLYVGDGTPGNVLNNTVSGSIVVNGGIGLSNDIAIFCADNDRSIKFMYGNNDTEAYGWRIKYAGTGNSNANYLAIESSGSTGTYTPAVRFGMLDLDTAFGGVVYPINALTQDLGSATSPWNVVHAHKYYIYDSNKKSVGNLRVQTNGTATEQGEAYLVVGNSTPTGTAGNSRGSIYLYNTNSGYIRLLQQTSNSSKYTIYLPGANGQLVHQPYTTAADGTVTIAAVGGVTTPVYVSSTGKVVACTMTASKNRWGVLSPIDSSGIFKAGKYIDFHATDTSEATSGDYRLTATTTALTGSGSISATTSMSAGTTMTVGTTLTVGGASTLNGAVAINAKATVQDIVPKTSSTYSLGSTAYKWKQLFVGAGDTDSIATGVGTGAVQVNGGISTSKDSYFDAKVIIKKAVMEYDTSDECLYFSFN